MAKISAHGAEKAAEYRSRKGNWIYVVTTDGRVLIRSAHLPNSRYTLVKRCGSVEAAKRTAQFLAEGGS